MTVKKKDNRGRKPLPKGKKMVPITIYVPADNQGVARTECVKIAAKYR